MWKSTCRRISYWRVDPYPPSAASSLTLFCYIEYPYMCEFASRLTKIWLPGIFVKPWVLNSLDYHSFLKSLGILQFKPSFVILCQIVLATFFYITYTFGPSYPLVPHPGIQPTADWKYLERKIPEDSKKQNLNLPLSQQLFTSCLCCIR